MNETLSAELKVVKKRRAGWVVLSVLIAFLALNYLLTYFAPNVPIAKKFLLPKNAIKYTIFQLGSNGVFMAAIFGGFFFGSPFSWRTYETRLVYFRGRDKIFGGKLGTILVILTFWLIVGLAFGHIISFSLGFLEGDIAYSPPGFWLVIRAFFLVLAVWFCWFTLGGTISLWSRSTAMGVGLTLAYYFLENIIFAVPGFAELVEGYTFFFLGRASSGLFFQLFPGEWLVPRSSAAAQVAELPSLVPVIFGYLVGLTFLGWWRFRTMEISEG
ncbi:MAG: hypothetical protein ACOC6I_00670 [Candidatus Bipolaricaulota bacterium]